MTGDRPLAAIVIALVVLIAGAPAVQAAERLALQVEGMV